MKLVFIADYFSDQVLGGGELNNDELVNIFQQQNIEVIKIHSHEVSAAFIEAHASCQFIIANFINLNLALIPLIYNLDYVIYEHDHKYLSTRNPGLYKDFKAPPEVLTNMDFYKKAKAVFCQSEFHKNIVFLNTGLENLINLGGNIWDLNSLNFMSTKAAENQQKPIYAIMDSPIEHKNTGDAIKFCKIKKYDYKLIASRNYIEFLSRLSAHKALVFFPKTPETLSRVVVEARMMGMGVITNNMIGATSEPWYSLKGQELIDIFHGKREEIPKRVLAAF